MCPDEALLSAYYDGEVPSPWKERIEAHLEECGECRARMEGFSRVSRFLREGEEPEAEVQDSLNRIHSQMGHGEGRTPSPGVWHRRISLPLPAAAAAAVLLLLGGLLPAVLGRSGGGAGTRPVAESSQAIEWEEQDLESLLRTLESDQDFYQEVEWQLPEGSRLSGDGRSRLIREVDYRGRGNP